jgi:hypothetical protein
MCFELIGQPAQLRAAVAWAWDVGNLCSSFADVSLLLAAACGLHMRVVTVTGGAACRQCLTVAGCVCVRAGCVCAKVDWHRVIV